MASLYSGSCTVTIGSVVGEARHGRARRSARGAPVHDQPHPVRAVDRQHAERARGRAPTRPRAPPQPSRLNTHRDVPAAGNPQREHVHRHRDADVDQHAAPDRARAHRERAEDQAGADRAERLGHRLAVVDHAVRHDHHEDRVRAERAAQALQDEAAEEELERQELRGVQRLPAPQVERASGSPADRTDRCGGTPACVDASDHRGQHAREQHAVDPQVLEEAARARCGSRGCRSPGSSAITISGITRSRARASPTTTRSSRAPSTGRAVAAGTASRTQSRSPMYSCSVSDDRDRHQRSTSTRQLVRAGSPGARTVSRSIARH